VAMTYAVGSLAFKHVMRIGNSQPCFFCRILVCLDVCISLVTLLDIVHFFSI